ncbi:hypothetical protein H6G33_29730 [Calothrix sp. FACHB-1219]|uniref:hypothetical protein n=1 Tax=unclassified Calothrix TaxID=2619626 RepID=UPI001681DC9F|nr:MULTISPECIES: hypothetical protein [unclassified Calothrix]MBD2203548.1 hypothetical protein [Calothrix sp. FACHB-168]MBD2221159.1 hypothetical protein [Calothrix sp. FACHB-1219]
MLKPLLLSGWFRAQPLVKYAVIAVLIAPLVAASGHSTSANQSEVANNTSDREKSGSATVEIAAVSEPDLADLLTADPSHTSTPESDSQLQGMATSGESPSGVENQQSAAGVEGILQPGYAISRSNVGGKDPLAAVELAPSTKLNSEQLNLLPKLKHSKIKSLQAGNNSLPRDIILTQSLAATQVTPILTPTQPNANPETSVSEQPGTEQAANDPIGSPHPIPWKWITATQEAIASNGGSGVRYYRSVPVASPDGKYVVYSRVRLEVKPEMYNSRVTSVLFVEEVKTKKLRVIASTSVLGDPLLNVKQTPETGQPEGTIGVLVPVSWSEKGDRFLARRFEGIFNTADATDRAVIWDSQNNQANTVSPVGESEEDHEKIAVLLGWSKGQPDRVLFRAGQLGEEEWPLVQVAADGKIVTTNTNADQPITFGQKHTDVWAGPQVASR